MELHHTLRHKIYNTIFRDFLWDLLTNDLKYLNLLLTYLPDFKRYYPATLIKGN